jgi:hypothetical protein
VGYFDPGYFGPGFADPLLPEGAPPAGPLGPLADDPYFSVAYFDPTYFYTDDGGAAEPATTGSGGRLRPSPITVDPAPPNEDLWMVLS